MDFKRHLIPILCVISLSLCVLCSSCNNGSASADDFNGDTVAVETIKLADTSSFVKSNGDKCGIIAEATIAMPARFKDDKSIELLRRLVAKHLFYASDSVTVDDALKFYISNTLHQYDFSDAPASEEIELDNTTENVQTYNNSVTVSVYYNKHNLITFCKVEVVKKDNQITSVTHRYYSFDLESMTFVELNNVFREESMPALCNELRNRLMDNNKVTSNDQLNEIGFFNIDNLNVTRNFYFDKNGITWSYLPNELAVEALGEPTVTLEYDIVEPYLSDKSIIKRLF